MIKSQKARLITVFSGLLFELMITMATLFSIAGRGSWITIILQILAIYVACGLFVCLLNFLFKWVQRGEP